MSSDLRYSRLTIAIHWFMFLLIAAVYAAIESREFFERGSDIRNFVKTLHYMLGLSVLALVIVRIVARFFSPAPPLLPPQPAWQRWAAGSVHYALYALMIAMPIGGWLLLSAEGDAIPFFGLELPALIAPNEGLAEQIEELHETCGVIGYWLIGLHTLAALGHHYLLRDNGLTRMLPRFFKQRS